MNKTEKIKQDIFAKKIKRCVQMKADGINLCIYLMLKGFEAL